MKNKQLGRINQIIISKVNRLITNKIIINRFKTMLNLKTFMALTILIHI